MLEGLLTVTSSVSDEEHNRKVNFNWQSMREFGIVHGPCLIDMKNELLQIINDLVFLNDGTKDDDDISDRFSMINKEAFASSSQGLIDNNNNNNNNNNNDNLDLGDINNNGNNLPEEGTVLTSEISSTSINTSMGQGNNLRVRSKAAFGILERVYSSTWSQWTRMEILTRILMIMHQASNVQVILDLHAIEPMLLRMPTVGQEERKKVISILEFVIQTVDANVPPLGELSALKQLLREASDRDMVTLVLQTIKKIIIEKPLYKQAFRLPAWWIARQETKDDASSIFTANNITPITTSPKTRSQHNLSDSLAKEVRLWQIKDVMQWFDQIDNGRFANRFHTIIKNLNMNGQILLAANDDWLQNEMDLKDEAERSIIRERLNQLKQVIYIYIFFFFIECFCSEDPLCNNTRLCVQRTQLSCYLITMIYVYWQWILYKISFEEMMKTAKFGPLYLLNIIYIYIYTYMYMFDLHSCFEQKRCNRAVYGLLKSRTHVEAAIKVIRNQLDDDSVSDILSSLNAERDSYEYRINMLEALRQMMHDSTAASKIKNSWHELGGFATVLSLSASLDSLWPNCDERTSQLAMDLIEKSFIVIISVIKNHPRNRAYFWYTSWNSIADAIIVTGVLKSSHYKRVFRIFFDLAMEELKNNGDTTTISAEKTAEPERESKREEEKRDPKQKEDENDNEFEYGKSQFLKNPEAILVILKILSFCPEQLQLVIFEKLLLLINLSVVDGNGEKRLLLRNKQLLADVILFIIIIIITMFSFFQLVFVIVYSIRLFDLFMHSFVCLFCK
ncbi:hypothetical protein RFI_21889 [Reticulomyxa filosa]|uniref:SAM domain-containing protein n=1 Tax=Reticulomyxa filosa TaxID=46433 RepID=X6MNQ8_RETFI|nr:hypothetical protein RFI_21889 [Reticulomyxa filosa]|eukprot:ETO15474.1 hypothetical protein RFI_21889 [Reticulomyxa filosa]